MRTGNLRMTRLSDWVRLPARAAFRRLPWKKSWVRLGAGLPSGLKGDLTVRLFSFLLYHMPSRDGSVRSNLGMRTGLRVDLPLSADTHYLFGAPERHPGETGALHLAKALLNDCPTFVDIGSYLGYYLYFLAPGYPDRRFLYFEPNAHCFKVIQANLRSNGIQNAKGFNSAVSEKDGWSTFHLDESEPLMSTLLQPPKEHRFRKVRVRCVSMDTVYRREKLLPDAIWKVDVENAEFLMVKGAARSLPKLRHLIMELLGPAREQRLADRLIRDYGFRCYYINRRRLERMYRDDGRYSAGQFNFWFTHDRSDSILNRLQLAGFTPTGGGI